MGEYLDVAKSAFEVPTLETNWTMRDIGIYVDDVRAFGKRKVELLYDKQVYEEFKKKIQALAEQLGKGKSQEATLAMLDKVMKTIEEVHGFVAVACSRLEDIGSSYTLYRDLILTTSDGTIVANANPTNRKRILGDRSPPRSGLIARLSVENPKNTPSRSQTIHWSMLATV